MTLGSSLLRAGWSFDKLPRLSIPANMSKYRDRKLNKSVMYAGWDTYADATTRGQIRNAFEPGTGIVANWDVMEGVLDYTFQCLGFGEDARIDRPIVMTEPLSNLTYSRRMMSELLFECYGAPSVTYSIDSLLSYRYNGGKTGLVVSSAHSTTHIIPVLDCKPMMASVSRLNWGGYHAADYLFKLLKLKYPSFPGKMTETQVQEFLKEHCYLSKDFAAEMRSFLDWTGLEARDHLIQYPFTEHVVTEKTEEELARAAERKRENGRRLQEQAAKMRLDKLLKKEQNLEYLKSIFTSLEGQTKKEIRRILDIEEFKDEAGLERKIKELEKSIRKSRNKDLGGPENEEEEETPSFPLLEIPDDQLDPDQLKEKRHQRLMKSGLEARQRARVEKEAEKARLAEEQRLDDQKREEDLAAWLVEKHANRETIISKIREKERFTADLGNRKSMASQQRMKTLANLASDQPGRKRRRAGGGDDDNFGANDDDWSVYRTVQQGEVSDSENEAEDLPAALKVAEALLLEYDPDFNESHTLGAQSDWTKSLLHAFIHGPRPFDPESQKEIHQIHLNVERIRVPEVVFQPAIAGVDQAGLVEIIADILNQRITNPSQQQDILKDVFLTGGNTLFEGFDERLRRELAAMLPADVKIKTRRAKDPLLDAWKGAAEWAVQGNALKEAAISREDFMEKGGEYLKVCLFVLLPCILLLVLMKMLGT